MVIMSDTYSTVQAHSTHLKSNTTEINVGDGDNFERELQEIIKDGRNMNDSKSTVHSGMGSSTGDSDQESGAAVIGVQKSTNVYPTLSRQFSSPGIERSPPPANMSVPLGSPTSPFNGDTRLLKSPTSKIDSIRIWSISTYKCTRQMLSEKFGKTSRTVDSELEAQIDILRDTQRKYSNVLRLARAMTSHFYHVVQTQKALGDTFSDLAQKSPELREEFRYNADTQMNLTKNGEVLLGALNFFVSSISTLCNKTMEDTLLTVKQYEAARVEFDAYRSDLEFMLQTPKGDVSAAKIEESQRSFAEHKDRFDQLRNDLSIKLKFLEENKVKVMHKQLLLFHNAISAYFSGNQTALESTLKQFNIKLQSPNSGTPSWLEKQSK